MLSPKMLRFVEEVAKVGSIRKAAARLNISSSAVNRHILALELRLDAALFERLPKRMRLTASGEVLVAHAQTMEKEHQRMLSRIAALKGMQRGVIRIATMGGLVNSPLLLLANQYIERRQQVLVRIEALATTEAIMSRVAGGESDIGLAYNLLPNPSVRVLESLDVEVGAVTAPGHPLAQLAPLRLAHCLEYPIATGLPTTVIRDLVEYAFASADLPFQPSVETDSIEVMKQFAAAGRCMTFLNPLDITAEIAKGELIWLRLQERHFPTPSLKLLVRTKSPLEAAAGRIAEDIRTRMAELKAGAAANPDNLDGPGRRLEGAKSPNVAQTRNASG